MGEKHTIQHCCTELLFLSEANNAPVSVHLERISVVTPSEEKWVTYVGHQVTHNQAATPATESVRVSLQLSEQKHKQHADLSHRVNPFPVTKFVLAVLVPPKTTTTTNK